MEYVLVQNAQVATEMLNRKMPRPKTKAGVMACSKIFDSYSIATLTTYVKDTWRTIVIVVTILLI